ncbi:MAG: NapC/NirT family cytochrome c [Candidatus Eremiobacteraeota bacterium]|nr:NapC/NirT family cytochrome c [Candidatus Eremiobacteraeota bacterium]
MDKDNGKKILPGPGESLWKRGITLPFIRKTVSLRLLLLLVLFGALAGVLSFLLAVRQTSSPTFCFSCHEMGIYYESWKNSPHKDLQCVQCHISPGTKNLVVHKTKSLKQVYVHFKGVKPGDIKGHVPDVNCTQCHKESPELVEYHSLKITHKKHLTLGVKCVFCHKNVVHGAGSDFLHNPTMATCITCHDGKKTSNKCSVCHVGEIERDRRGYQEKWVTNHKRNIKESGEESCKRCHHKDYCTNCHKSIFPHSRDFESSPHIADAKKDESRCKRCHDKQFCDACHDMKWQHPIDWMRTHVSDAEKKRKKCDECHKQDFCDDCHTKLAQHQTGYEAKHAAEARQHPGRCKSCHEESYCVKCHEHSVPVSHGEKGWMGKHKKEGAKKNAQCSLCHKQDFCVKCHKTSRPSTHNDAWTEKHGGAAQQDRKACRLCHDSDSSCDQCHTLSMPHSGQWMATHRSRTGEGFCLRCHTEKECASCHRSKKPSSHGRSWEKSHGAALMAGKENCFKCHAREACDRCHGLALPHPGNWGIDHKAAYTKKETMCLRCHKKEECVACHRSVTPPSHKGKMWKKEHKSSKGRESQCALCHTATGRQSACKTCHGGIELPHAKNYGMDHGKESREKSSSCIKCHTREECLKCHQAMPPSNHKEEWKLRLHKQDALKRKDLCKACHDAGECRKCHPEEKSKIK